MILRAKGGLAAAMTFAWLPLVARAEDPPPGDLTDPVEILKKADEAARAVRAVRYHAVLKGSGEYRIPDIEGTVTMSGWTGRGPEKFLVDARIRRPGSGETLHVTIGGDGERYFVLDHAHKKAYVDDDPLMLGGTGRPLLGLLTMEFVHPDPFGDELRGEKQELLGGKTIGGVPCYEVRVVYAADLPVTVWHFGKRDFLPRARLDIQPTPRGKEARRHRIMTKLELDPTLDEAMFSFTVPEGYERIEGAAP